MIPWSSVQHNLAVNRKRRTSAEGRRQQTAKDEQQHSRRRKAVDTGLIFKRTLSSFVHLLCLFASLLGVLTFLLTCLPGGQYNLSVRFPHTAKSECFHRRWWMQNSELRATDLSAVNCVESFESKNVRNEKNIAYMTCSENTTEFHEMRFKGNF